MTLLYSATVVKNSLLYSAGLRCISPLHPWHARLAAHRVDESCLFAIHEKSHLVFFIIPVAEMNICSIVNETEG
jgi:hypothetical protein